MASRLIARSQTFKQATDHEEEHCERGGLDGPLPRERLAADSLVEPRKDGDEHGRFAEPLRDHLRRRLARHSVARSRIVSGRSYASASVLLPGRTGPEATIACRNVFWRSTLAATDSRDRSRPLPSGVPPNDRWLPALSIRPRVIPRSINSLIRSIPVPQRISNSASVNGGAHLF